MLRSSDDPRPSRLRTMFRAPSLSSVGLALHLALPMAAGAQIVQGRVLDMDSGEPVASAVIGLLEGERGDRTLISVASDQEGRFRIQAPTGGTYRIRAAHIGYRAVTTPPFDLGAGAEALEVEVFLGVEAIPLAPMLIVSDRPARMDLRLHNRGFYERQRRWGREGLGFGHFLDREAIERRNAFTVVDVLRDVPGVRIESRGGRRPGEITLRSVTSIGDMGLRCSPLIFLDGVPAASGSPDVPIPGVTTDAHIADLVSPADLAGVEVYPGITQPAEFLRGNHCGVIVLWTGGRSEGPAPAGPGFEDGRGRFSVELRVGSGIGDYGATGVGMHWAPGVGGGVVADWRILSWLSAYAGASRSGFRCARGECAELDASFASQGLDLGLRGELEVRGRPWIRLGVVRHHLEIRWAEAGGKEERTSPRGLGVEGSVGFELPVSRSLSLTPGVRYLRWAVSDEAGGPFVDPFSTKDPLGILAFGVGLRVRF